MLVHRFIIVGIYNTIIGYAIFVGLNFLLKSALLHYLVILTISYILSVTHAYITQRYFVFKTRGRIIGEYTKFFSVNLAVLATNAGILHMIMESRKFGFVVNVEIAQAISLLIVTGLSYLGHKFFSFSTRPAKR